MLNNDKIDLVIKIIEKFIETNRNRSLPQGLKLTNCKNVLMFDTKIKGYDNPLTIINSENVVSGNNNIEFNNRDEIISLLCNLVNLLKNDPKKHSSIQDKFKEIKTHFNNSAQGLVWLKNIADLLGLSI